MLKLDNPSIRKAFLIFFASHIPITLIIDSQAVLPEWFHPQILKDLLKWYNTTFQDVLMTNAPLFLRSLVTFELLFQLPFFVYAVHTLLAYDGTGSNGSVASSTTEKNNNNNDTFQKFSLIYGTHTATTLIPILATILDEDEYVDGEIITMTTKMCLFGFYLPYLIFPVWLVVIAAMSESSQDMFVSSTTSSLNNSQQRKEQ